MAVTRGVGRHSALCALLLVATHGTSWSGAAVKIGVNRTGIYAVTGADLAAAGVELGGIEAGRLAMACQGRPAVCRVIGAHDGKLAPDSRVVFYGEALNTEYTDTNVYWLSWEGEPGLRMEELALGADNAAAMGSFRATAHFEENHEYGYLIWAPDGGEVDPWFWQTIRSGKIAAVKLDLADLAPGGGSGRLRVMLRGRTSVTDVAPDHHVLVEFNGKRLGDEAFDGQAAHPMETDLPPDLLKPTGNDLTISVPGDTGAKDVDHVFLDWIEIEYPRSFECGKSGLTVTIPQGVQGGLRLTGVETEIADLYDVTDPLHPRVAAGLPAVGGVVSASVSDPATRKVVAVTSAGYLSPAGVLPGSDMKLRDKANGADYIIITHDSLLDAVRPLARHRAAQGLRVAIVPVSAVCDEFGWGVIAPRAIRDFLKGAYESWQRPAPRYVLLVGDASYDARDYLGTGTPNLIPTYQAPVFDTIEMSTDQFYVDFSYGPEALLIGRIPAQRPGQLTTVIEKIIRYETRPARPEDDRVLLLGEVEKGPDGALGGMAAPGFLETRAAMMQRMSEVSIREVLVDPSASREQTVVASRREHTPALLEALSGGCGLVAFHGHGDRRFWGLGKVFQLSDISSLKPAEVAPVVLNVSCFTGEFDSPYGECTGEALLFAPETGATAFVGPGRLGGFPFDRDSFRLAAGGDGMTLGELAYCGKWDLCAEGVRHPAVTFATLGDPALRLRFRLAADPR